MPEVSTSWKPGGCHCGAVRYQILAPDAVEATACTCSICRMTGYLHLIVPKERFRLLQGEDKLTTYTFNTRTAQHRFCSVCGIKSFYVPNIRCLDQGAVRVTKITSFDGTHWEDNIDRLGTDARE
jgi:hypothetical protein